MDRNDASAPGGAAPCATRRVRDVPLLSLLRGLLVPPACCVCGGSSEADIWPTCAACEGFGTPKVLPSATGLARRVALARHDGELRRAVHGLKYRGETWRGRPLGRLLASAWDLLECDVERSVLVPSPLSARRLRVRGYNQSALLARGVRDARGVPIAWGALRRVRDDGPQAGRSRAARRGIRGSFHARFAPEGTVVLVDDVTTTGETLSACALALRAAGATDVRALTLAWADSTDDGPEVDPAARPGTRASGVRRAPATSAAASREAS